MKPLEREREREKEREREIERVRREGETQKEKWEFRMHNCWEEWSWTESCATDTFDCC